MKIVLHGKLKAAFGDSFQIHADTVEDAIRALSSQLPEWPQDLIIEVPGFETVEKLTARTDIEEIDLIPALMGGGGKFGMILLGVALIATAVFAQPLAAAFGTAMFSSTATTAMLSMGIGLTLTGVMQLFMKAPSISRANDPAASKYLGLNKNTTAIGTPISLCWGRIPPGGQYLSIQSNSDNLVHAVWPTNPT